MHMHAGDRSDLADLVARYALAVDERRWDAVAGLFAHDGVLSLPDPPVQLDPVIHHHGRVEIAAALQTLTAVPVTVHAIVGAVFDAADDPDAAVGTITCVAHHITGDQGAARDLTWYVRYRDMYARVDGRWLLRRRALHLDAITTGKVAARRAAVTDR
ncbi:nuclear transport factor 2 family protein [Microbacterium sp. zg.Y1090]|uniref:nuclear transport factor 2 family protein n=1 Tax=Microbacterium TaxID=33882 RepID=UPI00214B7750|nr:MULTISPECIES: nuclear transport factor 2 family protein [unclassified Microbacterium]MCR2813299.1 nuclear transport factor 2 family protein [Microbacterium sp. zg.Y1084]MCR2819867.1 nuclear transport factor 2 family protein [Microbacterium sp. zg.Y1090]MDL5487978.1 nuclear transport factor 2 family protein [Microbacterium sp. zg-Y1211]WIM28576.1 nuclear transport factor 2 family protein [Microbacterium sp. zg-Y1090]